MPLADISFGDVLLTVLEIFILVAWFWILITIIGDLFRDHGLSGWAKALWVLVLIILPIVGTLIYLIARGHGMQERALHAQAEAQRQMDAYVRSTAASSPVDDLAKLTDMKEKGAISDAEFEQAKAKLLA